MGKFVGKLDESATPGERKVYTYLSNMFEEDPNVYCYYEPLVGENYPDFVVIGPDFGTIIIEVKDYLEDSLLEVSSTTPWVIRKNNEEENVRNPFRQVYKYWRTAKNRLSQVDQHPIHQMVVLAGISWGSKVGMEILAEKPVRISIMFREDLRTSEAFREKYNTLVPPKSHISLEHIRLIRGNLIPTSRLPTYRQTKLTETILDLDELRLLDGEQERMAWNLGDGHRLFFGVAGSGKTVLLIARARYLAKKHPDWNILVLCYNKLLARHIYRILNPQDYSADITVMNYHRWAKELITSAGSPYYITYSQEQLKNQQNKDYFFNECVPQLLSKVTAETKIRKYDAILIDEAQDFESNWFLPVIELLNPEYSSLFITCDGLQGIYTRKKFSWKSVGIQAPGRVKKLRRSYRTPKEIGAVATDIIPEDLLELIKTEEEFLATEEYARSGGIVELHVEQDRIAEYNLIAKKLKEFMERDLTVIVLFRKNLMKLDHEHHFLSILKSEGLKWADLGEWGQTSREILIGTPQGTKGLEADVVVIPEVDIYRRGNELQLLYVGMTRAIRRLLLTANKRTWIVDRIEKLIRQRRS